jgi:hypothetical protein
MHVTERSLVNVLAVLGVPDEPGNFHDAGLLHAVAFDATDGLTF